MRLFLCHDECHLYTNLILFQNSDYKTKIFVLHSSIQRRAPQLVMTQ